MTVKVKDLVAELLKLPQDDDIVITAMDDHFFLEDFEVHSAYDDGQAQEIILPIYVREYSEEETGNIYRGEEYIGNVEDED